MRTQPPRGKQTSADLIELRKALSAILAKDPEQNSDIRTASLDETHVLEPGEIIELG